MTQNKGDQLPGRRSTARIGVCREGNEHAGQKIPCINQALHDMMEQPSREEARARRMILDCGEAKTIRKTNYKDFKAPLEARAGAPGAFSEAL